jgi:NitT/TauT family transport system permease protein
MSRRVDPALGGFLGFGLLAALAAVLWNGVLLVEPAILLPWIVSMAGGALLAAGKLQGAAAEFVALAAAVAGAVVPLGFVAQSAGATLAPWIFVLALCCLVWRLLGLLGRPRNRGWLDAALVPGLFGIWMLYLWQMAVTGFGVPSVLLPPPSAIYDSILEANVTLWHDFYQTFIRSVIPGFVLGCASGFLVAVLADRFEFLERGLLPLGNLASALPIVGVAPIMVMWFGFDWQSKAAVVVVMTFFPMLVNTLAGLRATDRTERDLMRSYGASELQTLLRVRLPNAAPFIFNALKINSTLALIGAIVAEFFGTPIVGMGFRISAEVGRMNIAMVWATIAVAAVAGSASYGALALLEQRLTFWHPSNHRKV